MPRSVLRLSLSSVLRSRRGRLAAPAATAATAAPAATAAAKPRVIATIGLPREPLGVAISPRTGTVYVPSIRAACW
jgi:hypothetical protein